MLDVHIIERIREDRERARSEDARIPLHITPPPVGEAPPRDWNNDRRYDRGPEDSPNSTPSRDTPLKDEGERGWAIIDFQL